MSLFHQSLNVINMGLSSFASDLEREKALSCSIPFRPPLLTGLELLRADALLTKHHQRIEEANSKALSLLKESTPYLTSMGIAKDLLPNFQSSKNFKLLHAGPPVSYETICGPLKGALLGAILYENWATTLDEADRVLASGKVELSPCHDFACVGPMAGVISPSMPLFIIEEKSSQNKSLNKSYATMNEGLGKVLRFGANSVEVMTKLRWMEKNLYPILKSSLEVISKSEGGINLKLLMSMALHMGDELHNRNRAATSLFVRKISEVLPFLDFPREELVNALKFINSNDHFFLNLSMAASKLALDQITTIHHSSLISLMARNGTNFGIKIAGIPNSPWFTAPSPLVKALYFPTYSEADANPDLGDSAITETFGLGAFAMAAAPAITQFVGGNFSDATKYTLEMGQITSGTHQSYQIPSLDFKGCPLGIDLRKVITTGILPIINTGVAHKLPGIGQIGAGIVRAPREIFVKAFHQFLLSLEN